MLVHHMTLVSFRLLCKNLDNLREFLGQMVHRPHWQKIARTPMLSEQKRKEGRRAPGTKTAHLNT